MADLTPELLAQLEDGFRKWASAEGLRFQEADRIYRLFVGAAPALVAAAKEREQLRAEVTAMVDAHQAAGETAVRHLRESDAAAKERDQLQRQVEGSSLGGLRREVAQLRDILARRKVEIEQMSELLGQSQFDRVNLAEQADQLRAEVERLRGLGLEAVETADDLLPSANKATQTSTQEVLTHLRAEIERKP